MPTLNYSIQINAPVKRVWDSMLDDTSYRLWTKPFHESSYYKGNWEEGSEIEFLGPWKDPETGEEGLAGMAARIKVNRLYEYLSIEHRGEIFNGFIKPFANGNVTYENYSFSESNGVTEIKIELIHMPEQFTEMFNEMWPRALDLLKEIAENGQS